MADYYYSSPSDFVASFDRQLKQRRLGGQTYDPRLTTDVARGAYSAAVSKMLDRKKAADAKEASDKALSLQEQSLTNTKDYQKGVLANADEANRIKALEAANANTYRMGALDTADAARKDASDASLYNAALNLGGKLFNGLFQTETKDPKTGQVTRKNAAYDWFKDTVMGGDKAGSGTGYAIGDYGDITPEQASLYEAEATVPVTASPAIGTNVSQGATSTNDLMTQAYDDSMTSEKPKGSGYNLAAADTGTMNDAGGSLPAIGEQVTDRNTQGGTSKYEDIDIGTQMAEGTETSTATGSDTANVAEWNGQPPDAWQDPDPFQAEEYVAPELEGYTAPTLDPWNYTKKPSDWTEKMWFDSGLGHYGKDYKSDLQVWQGAQYRKDALQSQAKYNTWSNEQNAASRNAYDQWAAEQNALAKADYDQQMADAEAEYDDYWTGEKAKYDDAVNKYDDAVKNYEAGVDGVGVEKGPSWDYNRGGIGGAPADDYYGDAFIQDAESMTPLDFDPSGFAGDVSTRKEAKNYMPAAYSLGGGEYSYEPAGVAEYNPTSYNAAFNYEPATYESPYRYSSSYNPTSIDSTPNYEPAYENDEAFNYEPGSSYEATEYGGYTPSQYYSNTPTQYPSWDSGGRTGTSEVVFEKALTIVCTELHRRGYLSDEVLASDSEYRQKMVPFETYTGYLALFGPVVALMKRSTMFANIVRPFGVATAREMASRVNPDIKGNILGRALLKVGLPLCQIVGRIALGAVTTAVQHTEVA